MCDTYENRPVAAGHEMGIFEHMDVVYDLKMLDEEGEIQTRYRLIHFYYDSGTWELYDLEKDPSEMNKLCNHPDYRDV